MDMRTDGIDTRADAKAPRGRKDNQGQEAVIKPQTLKDGLKNLAHLKAKAEEANQKLKDAVKAIAEKSGLEATVVRKFVNARHAGSEKFDNEKRRIEQLGIVFEEIGYQGEVSDLVDASRN